MEKQITSGCWGTWRKIIIELCTHQIEWHRLIASIAHNCINSICTAIWTDCVNISHFNVRKVPLSSFRFEKSADVFFLISVAFMRIFITPAENALWTQLHSLAILFIPFPDVQSKNRWFSIFWQNKYAPFKMWRNLLTWIFVPCAFMHKQRTHAPSRTLQCCTQYPVHYTHMRTHSLITLQIYRPTDVAIYAAQIRFSLPLNLPNSKKRARKTEK